MATTNTEQYSSSPIVLGIAGAIIVGTIGGWLLLNNQSSAPLVEQAESPSTLAMAMPRIASEAVPIDTGIELSLIHISEPTRRRIESRRRCGG